MPSTQAPAIALRMNGTISERVNGAAVIALAIVFDNQSPPN